MTESEAIGFIQGKLNCMERCDRFDCKNTDECDNCEYCYSQGAFGEQTKAFQLAINALEKQIPKKLIKWSDGTEHCPDCDCDNSCIGYGVCIDCGQKLDWSDTD